MPKRPSHLSIRSRIFCLFLLLFLHSVSFSAVNLLRNSEFLSQDGHHPQFWNREQNRVFPACFRTSDGVLRISEKTPNYYNAISQTVAVNPEKSYYFEIEYKMDAQTIPAGIFYVFLDKDKKKVGAEHFLLRSQNEQKEWSRLKSVISIPNPLKTRNIRLVLVNYSKNSGNPDNAIYFRRPVFEVYINQKTAQAPPAPEVSRGKIPAILFSHNMTHTPKGVPYKLEKGEVGFLRLDTGVLKSQPMNLKISHPSGVQVQLYLHRGGKYNVQVPKAAESSMSSTYHIPAVYQWLTWGNALLFQAGPQVPDQFTLTVELEAAGRNQHWRHKIPVRQLPPYQAKRLPSLFAYSSWQAFPISRIDLSNPANSLAIRLHSNWQKSGWKHNPELRATRYVPHRHPEKWQSLKNLSPGRSISGAPVDLFCDSSLIAAGPEFFADLIRKMKYDRQVQEASQFEIDYEPYTAGPVTLSCFCDRCITAFQKKLHLSTRPAGMDILRNYEKEWVQFRMEQRAAMIRTAVQGFKQINPDILFRFCSMPLPPVKAEEYEYFRTYGIDLRLYKDFTDIFTPMNYTGTLNFYRSLEREAKELAGKNRATIISNGWGDIMNIIPRRCALQMLSAFFCDNAYPVIGQGLFLAQGDFLITIKKMMNDVAATEQLWSRGKLDTDNKIQAENGFQAEGSFYHFSRTAPDGKRWILALNNNKDDTVFARIRMPNQSQEAADLLRKRILIPSDGCLTLRLSPLEYRLIQLNPCREFPRWQQEKSSLIREKEQQETVRHQAFYRSVTKHGMSCHREGNSYFITTPRQKLILSLQNSAEGTWTTDGKPAGACLGRCVFMDRGAFALSDLPARLESCRILPHEVIATFCSRITTPPYDGLLLRKTYTVYRNSPKIQIKLAVVPEGGFRMFRCRAVTEISVGKEIPHHTQYAPRIIYQVGAVNDRSGRHVNFIRQGAVFPKSGPFLTGYARISHPLTGQSFIASDSITGGKIRISAADVDQLFCWRTHDSATMELIWPDAYPHYDPHLVHTWEKTYILDRIE